jgi:hypothetical protein
MIEDDYYKIAKCIRSCRTKKQLQSIDRMIDTFEVKRRHMARRQGSRFALVDAYYLTEKVCELKNLKNQISKSLIR